jgi:hypothetical protein
VALLSSPNSQLHCFISSVQNTEEASTALNALNSSEYSLQSRCNPSDSFAPPNVPLNQVNQEPIKKTAE